MARPTELCFVDCETTGLDPNRHEIIEVAGIRTTSDGVTVLGEYTARVMPQHIEDASPEALRVNGFDAAEWARTAVPIRDALGGLASIAFRACHAGQNPAFDARFLRAEAHRARCSEIVTFIDYHPIDTASMAMPLVVAGKIESVSLDKVSAYLGFPRAPGAHRARDDADLARRVFVALTQAYSRVAVDLSPPPPPILPPDGLASEMPAEVVRTLEEIETVMARCADLPDRAGDFADGVWERLTGIRETIERTLRVTPGQRDAIRNMDSGIDKWLTPR